MTDQLTKFKNEKYFDKLLNETNQKKFEEAMASSCKRYLLFGPEDQWKAFVHAFSIDKHTQLPYKKTINNYWNRYSEQKVVYAIISGITEKEALDKYIDKWNGLYPFESSPSKFDKEESYTIFPMFMDLFICSSSEAKELFRGDEKYGDFKVIDLE